MRAIHLPDALFDAYMAGRYASQRDTAIEAARNATMPKYRCIFSQQARKANREMWRLLRQARTA